MDQTAILGGVVVFLLAARFVARHMIQRKAVNAREADIRWAWEETGAVTRQERDKVAVSFLLSELAKAQSRREGQEQVRVIKLLPDDILEPETRNDFIQNLEYLPLFNEFLAIYDLLGEVPAEFVFECIVEARAGTGRPEGDSPVEKKMIMNRLKGVAANVAYILHPDPSVAVEDEELRERLRRYGLIS